MRPARVGVPRRGAQAQSSGVSTTQIPAMKLRLIGEGKPLEPRIRQTMESFFQADFSGVTVHEGPAAPAMGALAFTLGEQLHFAPGLYDPASREGVELLGHELTHVVQQRDGRVANPYGQGVAIVQDPALEAEADRMGQQIADQMWSRSRIGQPRMSPGRDFAAIVRRLPFPLPTVGSPGSAPPQGGAPATRTLQRVSWAKVVSGGGGGGGKQGGSGGGGSGGKKIVTPVKAPPKLTIAVTKHARRHYTHHQSQHLPTSDIALQALVLSSWNQFQDQGDGSYILELGEYNTRRQYGVWKPREWSIVVVPTGAPNTWLVTHCGPSS
jgi:hypothetical protein